MNHESPAIVTKFTNGLIVASCEMAQMSSVALGVWINAGTRHENADQHGIAHFMEHMAFKGTQKRNAREIAEQIESVGGYMNAYTSRDQTAYYTHLLGQDMALGCDVIADIVQNPVLAEEDINRERNVILQELAQCEDTPEDLIFDYLQECAFPDQALGWPILGTRQSLARFHGEDLRKYRNQLYGPGAMICVGAGAVSHDVFAAQMQKHFAALPACAHPHIMAARFHGGERRVNRPLEQAHIALALPTAGYGGQEYFAMQVFTGILGGGMSSRLVQEIREKRGLCYAIYSFGFCVLDGGLLGIYAGCGEKDAKQIVPLLIGEIEKLATSVKEEEVVRARNQFKAGILMGRESPFNRCEQIARQIQVFGRVLTTAELCDQIDAVDAAAICNFAQNLMQSKNLALAALGPIDKIEPYETTAARFGD